MATAEQTPMAEAEQSNDDRRRWSAWVHVGPGAADCQERFSGECAEEEHFHAWCHLPNPFQVRDIVMKSRAARARHMQMLRDESSDARAVLEEEIWALHDVNKEILVDEVLDKDFADDYTEAERSVREAEDVGVEIDEGEELPKLWENIDQDREEYERQSDLKPEDRAEDFEVLEQRVGTYGEAIEKAMEQRRAPRREALMEASVDHLINVIRTERMQRSATEVYLHTHASWTWYICTLKPVLKGRPTQRVWETLNQMRQEAEPDVIVALRETFDDLDARMSRATRGNS